MKNHAMLMSAFILMLASLAYADSIDDAEAKRRGISVQQVQLENAQARIQVLEAKIEELNKKLTLAMAANAKLSGAVETPKQPVTVPKSITSSAPLRPPVNSRPIEGTPPNANAKKVVLSKFDFDRLPVFLKYFHQTPGDTDYEARGRWAPQGSPMGFTEAKVAAIGYIASCNVEIILDDSSALVKIDIYDHATGLPTGNDKKTLIIEGMPTTGLSKDNPWNLKSYFKIVGTRKNDGVTFLVAQQIIKEAINPFPQ